MTYDDVVQKQKERGNVVGKLLPARWINLGEGEYTSEELKALAKAVDENYKTIKG